MPSAKRAGFCIEHLTMRSTQPARLQRGTIRLNFCLAPAVECQVVSQTERGARATAPSRVRLAFLNRLLHNRAVAKPALDISNLTPDEKLELIDELWQSVRPEDLALTPETRAELDRRLEKLDRDGPVGIAWADVRALMVPTKP
jgi:putative addiction module component (TIGR02574 family)